jgi:uncharacterized protein
MNDFFTSDQGRRIMKFATVGIIMLVVFLALESLLILKDINHSDPASNTISVSGTGESITTPNIATFSFSVSADAKVVSDAQSTVTTKTDAILKGLKALGIEDKDIKTSEYSVYPKYTYQSGVCTNNSCPPSRQVADGYTVSESITVKVRKTEDAGKALAVAGDNGATNISNLQLTLDDPNAPADEARLKAIDNAKEKAEALAKHLGVHIVRVVSFSDNAQGYPIYPVAYDTKAVSSQGASTPSIQVGENKTTANVTVTYEIR